MENKKNIQNLTSIKASFWKQKAEERKMRPWLKEYSSKIARRIIAIIHEGDKELNQTKLAETLNVSRQQVSKILKGQENLTLESIYKLSKALDCELISFPPYRYNQKYDYEINALSDNMVSFNLFLNMTTVIVLEKNFELASSYSRHITSAALINFHI